MTLPRNLFVFPALLLLTNCAVPVAPSGGPADRTPPSIESAEPPNGAVNVQSRTIRITFDEYISEPSFQQALSITPDPAERPELRWGKKTVEIKLNDELEPNTTYILTVDTKLRDAHGVSLTTPITHAFSTGPEINRGQIRGRVVDPLLGRGTAGIQIFAYPVPDSGGTTRPGVLPLYRTETDALGEFRFDYLSARPYFILAVRDRNGNRQVDNLETIAVPPVASVVADTSNRQMEHPWITTLLDTVPPEVRRVESLSATTIAVRYSEDIALDSHDASEWHLSDSLGTMALTASHVYRLPDDNRRVLLETDSLSPGSYTLRPATVRDSVGNPSTRSPVQLRITTIKEDDPAVFLSFLPADDVGGGRLHPTVQPGVLFSRSVTAEEIRTRVAAADTTGMALAFTTSSPDGVRHYLSIESVRDGRPFFVRVGADSAQAADSTKERLFSYLTDRDLGGMVGILLSDVTDPPATVQVIEAAGPAVVATTTVSPGGHFAVRELEAGSYSLRVTRDLNGNDRWDGGSIAPFKPAESLFWKRDSVRVRPRWDTEVDTLRIPF